MEMKRNIVNTFLEHLFGLMLLNAKVRHVEVTNHSIQAVPSLDCLTIMSPIKTSKDAARVQPTSAVTARPLEPIHPSLLQLEEGR